MTNFILGFSTCLLMVGVAFVFREKIRMALTSKLKRVEEKLNPPRS